MARRMVRALILGIFLLNIPFFKEIGQEIYRTVEEWKITWNRLNYFN
jgi:hypothetical protein